MCNPQSAVLNLYWPDVNMYKHSAPVLIEGQGLCTFIYTQDAMLKYLDRFHLEPSGLRRSRRQDVGLRKQDGMYGFHRTTHAPLQRISEPYQNGSVSSVERRGC